MLGIRKTSCWPEAGSGTLKALSGFQTVLLETAWQRSMDRHTYACGIPRMDNFVITFSCLCRQAIPSHTLRITSKSLLAEMIRGSFVWLFRSMPSKSKVMLSVRRPTLESLAIATQCWGGNMAKAVGVKKGTILRVWLANGFNRTQSRHSPLQHSLRKNCWMWLSLM